MLKKERRLMYVGITRAKRQLTLTHCLKRKKQGTWQFPEPSRFIDEMPQEDIKILGRKGGEPIVSKEEGRSHLAGMLDMLAAKGRKILNSAAAEAVCCSKNPRLCRNIIRISSAYSKRPSEN